MTETHPHSQTPSEWVVRWMHLMAKGGPVLDVACGGGRHARLLAACGHPVWAVDRDSSALASLAGVAGVTTLCADLEGGPWPYAGRSFCGIIVTNYLHRPLMAALVDALSVPGVLIYETFAVGNERYGRPSNPDHLLRPGELLEVAQGRLTAVAYEQVHISAPRPAVVQRICATRGAD